MLTADSHGPGMVELIVVQTDTKIISGFHIAKRTPASRNGILKSKMLREGCKTFGLRKTSAKTLKQ
jgi:hypothetical protein